MPNSVFKRHRNLIWKARILPVRPSRWKEKLDLTLASQDHDRPRKISIMAANAEIESIATESTCELDVLK